MPLSLEHAIGQKLMWSFTGSEPSPEILATLQQQHIGGITLFRAFNVINPTQVRALTHSLQQAARASGQPPLLIGADQEGGTLMAFPDTTPFPGNMALGATRSTELARQSGYAIGRELAAMGVNVNYAPVCDVTINPKNAVVGPRSFGEDPHLVARLSAAMIDGLQAAGVAAAPKHFPGHGDTATDSHYSTPIVLHDEARLRRVELPPFTAAVKAGAHLMMTAHIALPNFDGGSDLPATLSPLILKKLLRDELGFRGVILSDALDMHAIEQGAGLVIDAIAATAAGVDVLMLTTFTDQQNVYAGLLQATRRALLSADDVLTSAKRIVLLKEWIATQTQPSLDVINCAKHRALAWEIAAKAITLVRDEAHLLPLRLKPEARVAAIVPRPANLTPADTSSYMMPQLAQSLRHYHSNVEEIVIPLDPSESEIASLFEQIANYDLVIIGTINATEHAGQAALVNKLLNQQTPTLPVALRMPNDLNAYPTARTYICTYSIQPPALEALAKALWGEIPFVGQLPVSL